MTLLFQTTDNTYWPSLNFAVSEEMIHDAEGLANPKSASDGNPVSGLTRQGSQALAGSTETRLPDRSILNKLRATDETQLLGIFGGTKSDGVDFFSRDDPPPGPVYRKR